MTAEPGPADAVTFRGVILTPQPTQVVLTYRSDMNDTKIQPAQQISQHGINERHPLFTAISRIDARQVNGALSQRLRPLIFDQTVSILPEPNRLEISDQLVRSVVASLPTIEGNKSMLIPDINPAMPRPIGPDALPNNVPISQPIAAELGLKPGQVVQALVANAGDKMALQLKNGEIPLPSNLRLPEGQVQLQRCAGVPRVFY